MELLDLFNFGVFLYKNVLKISRTDSHIWSSHFMCPAFPTGHLSSGLTDLLIHRVGDPPPPPPVTPPPTPCLRESVVLSEGKSALFSRLWREGMYPGACQ
jgi:hypothetical protein